MQFWWNAQDIKDVRKVVSCEGVNCEGIKNTLTCPSRDQHTGGRKPPRDSSYRVYKIKVLFIPCFTKEEKGCAKFRDSLIMGRSTPKFYLNRLLIASESIYPVDIF